MTRAPCYDEGRTLYALDWLGEKLTPKGARVRAGDTGLPGLVVSRAYQLPDPPARKGARLVQ